MSRVTALHPSPFEIVSVDQSYRSYIPSRMRPVSERRSATRSVFSDPERCKGRISRSRPGFHLPPPS